MVVSAMKKCLKFKAFILMFRDFNFKGYCFDGIVAKGNSPGLYRLMIDYAD